MAYIILYTCNPYPLGMDYMCTISMALKHNALQELCRNSNRAYTEAFVLPIGPLTHYPYCINLNYGQRRYLIIRLPTSSIPRLSPNGNEIKYIYIANF